MNKSSRWLVRLTLLVTCVLSFSGPFSAKAKAADDAKARTDRYGDPLPSGAVARLGSTRWRYPHPVELVHFFDNGKQLLTSCGDGVLHVLDAATGKESRCFGTRGGWLEAVDTDTGTILQATHDGKIHLWNIATGKETLSFDSGFENQLRGLCFIRGREAAALGKQRTLKVWDLKTGKLSRKLLDDATAPAGLEDCGTIFQMAVSPDGETLTFTQSRKEEEFVSAISVLRLPEGKPVGKIPIDGDGYDSATIPVFSPDGKYLAWAAKDSTIHLYHMASLEQCRSFGKVTKDERLESVSFSRDGKLLAALTRRQTLVLYEVHSGKQWREVGETIPPSLSYRLERRGRFARDLHNCSPLRLSWTTDSKTVAQAWGPGMLRVWNVETGKALDVGIEHRGAINELIVSADGKRAVTLGLDNTVRHWDVATAREQRTTALPPETDFGKFVAPDRVLLCSREDLLSVWDIEKQQVAVKIQRDKETIPFWPRYDISSDRKLLLMVSVPSRLSRECGCTGYSLETGEMYPRFEKHWIKGGETGKVVSLARAAKRPLAAATIATPSSGGGLVVHGYRMVCKQSEADERVVWEIKHSDPNHSLGSRWAIAFAPDDRALLTIRNDKETSVSLLESTTGKERCHWPLPLAPGFSGPPFPVYAFSGNSDLLAVATEDEAIAVLDIRLGKEIARLDGSQSEICSVAFGADAATLFTGGVDGTVLVWDLRDHIQKARKTVPLSPAEVRRCWTELADADTLKAYQAMAALVTAPEQAVELLHDKLKPIEKVPAATIEKLIGELDSGVFETRQQASRQLLHVGPQCKAALEKRLANSRSLEQRRHIAEILADMKEREIHPYLDDLRELRAVEILEMLATPAARSILESLAKGAIGTRLTEEATFALERLKKPKS